MSDASVAQATSLKKIGAWPGIRVLAWDGGVLYGSRRYQIVRLKLNEYTPHQIAGDDPWEPVARFRPRWWRNLTARTNLTYRLTRDGFHALCVVGDHSNEQTMVGAVPGAIVTKTSADDEFFVTHRVRRGTRPLHVTAVPSGKIYWGEYFDNPERTEVHVYVSIDNGRTWEIAYTFSARSIRHIHNIVYDRWGDCLWILTGDEGSECKILRADCDMGSVEVVLSGNQQARAVAAIPTRQGLYFSTDTPSDRNHVYRLDRAGNLHQVTELSSSSIYGCKAGDAMFFSTMVEPSAVNTSREVHIVGLNHGTAWQTVDHWKKDKWPSHYFQYGNAFLPDGENSTRYLAATTIAVESDDLVTTLWEVGPA
jgi:hypothetical protein